MHVFEVFMQKMRYRLLIEYDGQNYAGWQVQNGQRTIQGEIERALCTILKLPVRITGGGRTDTGVHARGQTAHFDCSESFDCRRLQRSLNGLLDRDIRIKETERVASGFHARYDAKEREYRYYIVRTPVAIKRAYCWYVKYPLDLERMNQAAQRVKEMKDFKAFARTGSEVKHYCCEVREAFFTEKGDTVIFTIVANRFLYGMVRSLVGALVDIGRGRLVPENVLPKSSGITWQSAPAKGLVLERIGY
jgi:tRNA pseudouridine38-40 synthase